MEKFGPEEFPQEDPEERVEKLRGIMYEADARRKEHIHFGWKTPEMIANELGSHTEAKRQFVIDTANSFKLAHPEWFTDNFYGTFGYHPDLAAKIINAYKEREAKYTSKLMDPNKK